MSKRLHYVDWLRVLAVLLLFPYHTSRVFNYGDPFYIKSAQTSIALNYVLAFIDRWHMPLLFLLAGASTYFSLKKRGAGQYARERLLRLGVPLVFGILALIPPQTYIGGIYNSGYAESYWHYISSGDFLKINFGPGGDYYGGFGIGQLWFIMFLLVLSLVALPFFLWGRSERGNPRIQRWARRLAHPAWWLLPPLVIWFVEGLPDLVGKNPFYYLAFFVLGFIVIADDAFAESSERFRWVAIGLGIVACGAYVATGSWRDSLPDPSWPLFAANYGGFFGAWTLLIGILGVGRRYLDRPSSTLSYLAESSYPIYILHQTVIVVAAFWLVRMPVGLAGQWIAVFVVAVAASFALYEVVRRVGILRWLFGMRAMQPVLAPVSEPLPASAAPTVFDCDPAAPGVGEGSDIVTPDARID